MANIRINIDGKEPKTIVTSGTFIGAMNIGSNGTITQTFHGGRLLCKMCEETLAPKGDDVCHHCRD